MEGDLELALAIAILRTRPNTRTLGEHILHIRNKLVSTSQPTPGHPSHGPPSFLPTPTPTASVSDHIRLGTSKLEEELRQSRQRCIELEIELASFRNPPSEKAATKRRKVNKSALDKFRGSASLKEALTPFSEQHRPAVEFLLVVARFADTLQNAISLEHGLSHQQTVVDSCTSVLKMLKERVTSVLQQPILTDGEKVKELMNAVKTIVLRTISITASPLLALEHIEGIQKEISNFISSIPHLMALMHQVYLKTLVSSLGGGSASSSLNPASTSQAPAILVQDRLSQMLLELPLQYTVCIVDGLTCELEGLISNTTKMSDATINMNGDENLEQLWKCHTQVKTIWILLNVLAKIITKLGESGEDAMSDETRTDHTDLAIFACHIVAMIDSLLRGCIKLSDLVSR
ncbi:hypothetical protein SeMB42_g00693 [Synchytrium endobioticum]|uniref:Uncharacterized protein n=1 Tax=Synchytrium endobioticum TaxID=286115 RepID=A0A507D9Z6_9FUNG|nr:hypothetical protein SeLEV6574_g02142 [Synchytrium endobioticum]TPX53597.1 hypothetical protein SeMB42_g00693 [Synchytrium endobioticum]